MTEKTKNTVPTKDVMNDFKKIIVDFIKDILTTFPEYETKLNVHLSNLLINTDDTEQTSLTAVYEHCKSVYPVRFFEILYQNQELFVDKEKYSTTEFLPDIHFSELWSEHITDKTRDTIWKYLQLVLFTVVSTISDGASFGDTAKLFEAIDEDEFKAKLGETIAQMQNMFNTGDANADANAGSHEDDGADAENINVGDLPNPQDIHDHVAGMLDGKLGKLAKEIAEETAADLNMDMENTGSVSDVFKQLFKNPTKLMGLVKSVGSKLDERLKSGDINETELLKEASEMVQKMKDIPGMGNIQSMMSKMGMGMPSGGKMNMGAMQANIDRNMKASQQKDRMRSRLDARRAQAQQAAAAQQAQQAQQAQAQQAQEQSKLHKVSNQDGVETLVFSTGENVERSTASDKKKKKNKNKKK
jgi:hypothetical protein